MYHHPTFAAVLIAIVLAGCTSVPGEGPGGSAEAIPDEKTPGNSDQGQARGGAPTASVAYDDPGLSWQKTLEDDTMLLVVNASADLHVEMFVRYPDEPVAHSAAWILNDSHPMIAQRLGLSPMIAVQEHEVGQGIANPFVDPTHSRQSRSAPPGTHYVLLDSKGNEANFTLTSDNATIEYAHSDPRMATFRHHYDGDWDINLRLQVNNGEIFDATTSIPMVNEFLWVHIMIWAEWEWGFEFSPGCTDYGSMMFEGLPGYHVLGSREAMELHVNYTGMPIGHVWFYALDLPIEIEEPGCWRAEEYWRWGE